ncbi:MAG: hypothetical protein JWN04_5927 [Myxococcaceae bacterium]|nr:hypothetical protein [Myxococcaceae bacterium]
MHNRIEPYRAASCVAIIVLDWTVYFGTMTMHASWDTAWLASTIAGGLATLLLVAWFESRAPGGPRHAFVRATVAALAVAAPLPVLGSALGVACLFWLSFAKRPSEQAA